jgi:hypothetical protein
MHRAERRQATPWRTTEVTQQSRSNSDRNQPELRCSGTQRGDGTAARLGRSDQGESTRQTLESIPVFEAERSPTLLVEISGPTVSRDV